jgi:hypothetical protein
MRIRATCTNCGRDFLFLELYDADPSQADRCPNCGVHLGIPNMQHLARAADRALAALVRVLDQIADRSPGFTVDSGSVLRRLEGAVDALAPPVNSRRAA